MSASVLEAPPTAARETVLSSPIPEQSPVVRELVMLLRQSSHYLLGMVGALALGFVSFPIFTRMFSVADYGLIDFAQKILLLATAVGKAGMQNSTLRFFDRNRFAQTQGAEQRYYSTMFFGTGAVALVLSAIFVLGVRVMPSSVVDAPLSAALILVSSLIVFRALQSVQLSFLRIEEKTKPYNYISLGGKALIMVAVLGMVAWIGASVRAYLSGMVIAEIGLCVLTCVPLFQRRLLHWKTIDWALLTTSLSFGVPLVLQELAGIILDTGDRTLVRAYLGDIALGHYSVAYGLASYVGTLLKVPLGLAILPIYMRIWRSEGREKTIEFLSIGMDAFALVSAGLFAVACVASQDAVVVLASAKYQAAAPLIPTLVAGLLIYSVQIFLTAGLVIKKDTRTMAFALGVSAVLNLALNCVLLPYMGMQGAAVATLLSYMCCTAILTRLSFRVLPLQVHPRSLAIYTGAAALVCVSIPLLGLHASLGSLFLKSTLAIVFYAALVYAFDPRFRDLIRKAQMKLYGHTEVNVAVAN